MITAVPFQPLVAQAESIAVRGRNDCAARRGTAFRVRKIKPNGVKPKGPFEIIEPNVDILLRVVSILCNDVGPRSREIRDRHLPNPYVPILDATPVTPHA